MKVLVSDTSVLIDLERGSLLEAAFQLPYELAVPDILFERELKPYNGAELLKMGLRVEELDSAGVSAALTFRQREISLSLPDSFALALAQANSWMLLTGDGALRSLAHSESVQCHGTLWMLDQMYAEQVTELTALHSGLETIRDHPRCRLPRSEVNARLKKFSTILSNE